jgi:UDP-2,3-diacylglucosamine pyrophosphatase LpxH
VICGHIHHAEIKNIEDFMYINTGDFVESCTAIVEHMDGSLELVKWQKQSSETLEMQAEPA